MAKESEPGRNLGSPTSHFFMYSELEVHSSLFLLRSFPEKIIKKKKKIENVGENWKVKFS